MADTTTKLFEPDALMPEQFFANLGRDAGGSNERGLMLAILRDAVECYQKYALSRDPRGRDLHDEAAEWIFSRDREWPFSFENICDVLGVSAGYIRAGLAPLRQAGGRRVRKAPRIVELRDRRLNDDVELDPDEQEPLSKAG
ncbi:MAG TPA: hypothetical protein VEL28_22650 [Candidatus Binatia bacterium]|nr:hypothetical protein [Candidatus Binatia bacterium]